MADLASYEPKGDKQNSCFFQVSLSRVYERRSQSGLTQLVGAWRPW
jgi:DNA replication protein DnaC